MRSAIKFLGVSALALMLAPLGIAQSQGSTTQDSSSSAQTSQPSQTAQDSTGNGQYMPDKPEKNAPAPSTMNNIDAIGNRNVHIFRSVSDVRREAGGERELDQFPAGFFGRR